MEFLGVIKSYSRQKGYGFVACEETHALYGRDVFMHQKVVEDLLRVHPEPRQSLFFLGCDELIRNREMKTSDRDTSDLESPHQFGLPGRYGQPLYDFNSGLTEQMTGQKMLTNRNAAGGESRLKMQNGIAAADRDDHWLPGVLVKFVLKEGETQPKVSGLAGLAWKGFFHTESIVGAITSFEPPPDVGQRGWATIDASWTKIGHMQLGVHISELEKLYPLPQIGDRLIFGIESMVELPNGCLVPSQVERLDNYQNYLHFFRSCRVLPPWDGNILTKKKVKTVASSSSKTTDDRDEKNNSGMPARPAFLDQALKKEPPQMNPATSTTSQEQVVEEVRTLSVANAVGLTAYYAELRQTLGVDTGIGSTDISEQQQAMSPGSSGGGGGPPGSGDGGEDEEEAEDTSHLLGSGSWYDGVLKNYNADKNYGFASCRQLEEEGIYEAGRDVFVRNIGKDTFKIGEAIRFQIQDFEGKPQAVRVEEAAGNRYIGVIKSFDPLKGFGFIRCDELSEQYAGDVFLQASAYTEELRVAAPVGKPVEFCLWINNNKKPQALRLRSSPDLTAKTRYFGVVKTVRLKDSLNKYGFLQSLQASKRFGKNNVDIFVPGKELFVPATSAHDDVEELLQSKATLITDPGDRDHGRWLFAAGNRVSFSALRAPADLEVEEGGKRYEGKIKKLQPLKSFAFIECEVLGRRFDCDVFLDLHLVEGKTPLEIGDKQKLLNKKLSRLCGSHNANLDEIEEYLDLGASPNEADVSGFRPLMLCAMNITQKIELLIKYEADLGLPAKEFGTVLEWAYHRIGPGFAKQLKTVAEKILAGEEIERDEHGYLFQENDDKE
eukprot:g7956.t1